MEKNYCINCGAPINNSEFIYCENCGKLHYESDDSNSSRTYSSTYGSRVESSYGNSYGSSYENVKYHKNKYLAFFLSIFTGLGQIYNGQILKGILMPILLSICLLLSNYYYNYDTISATIALMFLAIYFYTFVEAYKTANDINKNNGNYFYSNDKDHAGFYEDNLNSFQKLDAQISSYFHYESITGEKTVSLIKATILIIGLYIALFILLGELLP